MEQAKRKLQKQSKQDPAAKGNSNGVEQNTIPGPSGLQFNVPTGMHWHDCLNICVILIPYAHGMWLFMAQFIW